MEDNQEYQDADNTTKIVNLSLLVSGLLLFVGGIALLVKLINYFKN